MFKETIKEILALLNIDVTQNMKYDRQTRTIIQKAVQNNSSCIDIGCHKGEILDLFLKYAPAGKHYGFEPIPVLYQNLKKKYQSKAEILPYALTDEPGEAVFNYVKNAPAYSGLKQRKYDVEKPEIEKVKVKLEKLDNIIPENQSIQLIKIDVEGAEFGVLKGGKDTICRNKPFIIFEFGLGASDYYGTTPEQIYHFLVEECNLQISLLKSWLKNKEPLSLEQLREVYSNNSEYYFIAHPA